MHCLICGDPINPEGRPRGDPLLACCSCEADRLFDRFFAFWGEPLPDGTGRCSFIPGSRWGMADACPDYLDADASAAHFDDLMRRAVARAKVSP